MSQSEISKRYAKALYMALSAGTQEKGLVELRAVAKVFESDPSIGAYFSNPLISASQKIEVARKAFSEKGLSPEILGLVILMSEKNRLTHLSSVVKAYEVLADAEKGITSGIVRAAKPLQPADQKELESKINQVLKKKIVLTFKEDPSLLGGVVAEVDGWTFDDSIDTHLKKLSEVLTR